MKCKTVKLLLAPYVLGDLAGDPELSGQLRTHLKRCNGCAKEYREIRQTIQFARKNRDIFSEVFAEIDLERESSEGLIKRPHTFHTFLRIGAAACLVIGLLIWMIFSNSKPKTLSQDTNSQQIASVPCASVQVEWLSLSGKIEIKPGQVMVADNECKELLINGKHQMIMNVGTSLLIKPLVENDRLGCLVQLTSGEIYAHVKHDGNPFVVSTLHGQAVITGTIFDIKTTDIDTTLMVSEGTVRFESDHRFVNVKAGQKSKLLANSEPSIPSPCNIKELTAWAIDDKAEQISTSNNFLGQTFELPLPERNALKLDEMNYTFWLQEKEGWFEREFPEVFELKYCLEKEGIEIDYSKLLIQSDAIWQFRYPDDARGKIATFSLKSLENTANLYGHDRHWLEEKMPQLLPPCSNHRTQQNPANISALEIWLETISNNLELNNSTLVTSWHAAVYLIETRTLIWFAVKNDAYSMTAQTQSELLYLIQRQVNAACSAEDLIRKLYQTHPAKSPCTQAQCRQLKHKLAENIENIISLEKEIAEHEISH